MALLPVVVNNWDHPNAGMVGTQVIVTCVGLGTIQLINNGCTKAAQATNL